MTPSIRSVSNWQEGTSFIDMDEEGGVLWTNSRLIIRNDPHVLKCIDAGRYTLSETLNGTCGLLGFEKYTTGCNGLRISKSCHTSGTLAQKFPLQPGGIVLSEYPDSAMPEELTGDESRISWMPLVNERGVGFPVNRMYHEYIMHALGPDAEVRIGDNIPLQYVVRNSVEALLMPYQDGLVRGELENTQVTLDMLHSS